MLLNFTRTYSGLVPFDDRCWQWLRSIEIGSFLTATIKRPRNIQFHRKFFALLQLAFDYWEPAGGLVSSVERAACVGLAMAMDTARGEGQAAMEFTEAHLQDIEQRRAEKWPAVDKSFEALRAWVTVEAGFWKLEISPSGVRKVPKSISFASMDEDEFGELYRAVFAVCWRLVLSQHFESEAHVENAMAQLGEFA